MPPKIKNAQKSTLGIWNVTGTSIKGLINQLFLTVTAENCSAKLQACWREVKKVADKNKNQSSWQKSKRGSIRSIFLQAFVDTILNMDAKNNHFGELIKNRKWDIVAQVVLFWKKFLEDSKKSKELSELYLKMAKAILASGLDCKIAKEFLDTFKIINEDSKKTGTEILIKICKGDTPQLKEKLNLLFSMNIAFDFSDFKTLLTQFLEVKITDDLKEIIKTLISKLNINNENKQELSNFIVKESIHSELIILLEQQGLIENVNKYWLARKCALDGVFNSYQSICEFLEKENKDYCEKLEELNKDGSTFFETLLSTLDDENVKGRLNIIFYMFKKQPKLVVIKNKNLIPNLLYDIDSEPDVFEKNIVRLLKNLCTLQPQCLSHFYLDTFLSEDSTTQDGKFNILNLLYDNKFIPLKRYYLGLFKYFVQGNNKDNEKIVLADDCHIPRIKLLDYIRVLFNKDKDPILFLKTLINVAQYAKKEDFNLLRAAIGDWLKNNNAQNFLPKDELNKILHECCAQYISYELFPEIFEFLVSFGADANSISPISEGSVLFTFIKHSKDRMAAASQGKQPFDNQKELTKFLYLLEKANHTARFKISKDMKEAKERNIFEYIADYNRRVKDNNIQFIQVYLIGNQNSKYTDEMRRARETIGAEYFVPGELALKRMSDDDQNVHIRATHATVSSSMVKLSKQYLKDKPPSNVDPKSPQYQALESQYFGNINKEFNEIVDRIINSLIEKIKNGGVLKFTEDFSAEQNPSNVEYFNDHLRLLRRALRDPGFYSLRNDTKTYWTIPEFIALRWLKMTCTRRKVLNYVDPVSKHKVSEALIAVWRAIKDNTYYPEKKDLDSIFDTFVNMLSRIQREYNKPNPTNFAPGFDPDSPSCDSGTFNMIISILEGHALINISQFSMQYVWNYIHDFYEEVFNNRLSVEEKNNLFKKSNENDPGNFDENWYVHFRDTYKEDFFNGAIKDAIEGGFTSRPELEVFFKDWPRFDFIEKYVPVAIVSQNPEPLLFSQNILNPNGGVHGIQLNQNGDQGANPLPIEMDGKPQAETKMEDDRKPNNEEEQRLFYARKGKAEEEELRLTAFQLAQAHAEEDRKAGEDRHNAEAPAQQTDAGGALPMDLIPDNAINQPAQAANGNQNNNHEEDELPAEMEKDNPYRPGLGF